MEEMDPGPRDKSVLHLQPKHRSTEIWLAGGGDPQRCRRRNPNQEKFPRLHPRMIPLLVQTGFYGISRVTSLQLDWNLISALVERWRPETHTFHLPIGECTITLQDVAILLGLPVDGEPVVGVSQAEGGSWSDIVGHVFGQSPPTNRFNGARLQLSWFQSVFPSLADDASEEELIRYTQSYLLQMIAGSMFTDHSGGLVHCMWVPFIQDLEVCGKYAWGAAVLAYLYRELCKATKIDTEEIAGCLILLQLWAWERLPTIAPLRTNHSLIDEAFWAAHPKGPLGLRWLVRHAFSETTGRTVSLYRVALDELASSHFKWQPYKQEIIDALPAYCFSGQDIWRYRGPLVCIFIVEPHMADRVLRQFGMIQTIPIDAEYSHEMHQITLKGKAECNWIQKHQASIYIWTRRLDYLAGGIVGDGAVPEYHTWYTDRTRRFHSRIGGVHVYTGDLLRKIVNVARGEMPGDVTSIALEGWHHIQVQSHKGLFEDLSGDDRRQKEREEGTQVVGSKRKKRAQKGTTPKN